VVRVGHLRKAAALGQLMGKVMVLVSAVANMSQYHRYAFGAD
jgi:hypothetical protein